MSRKPTRLTAPERLPLGPGWTHRAERQIRSLVLYVDLVGSRWIWPAHVGWVVGPDGSRPVPSDRLDDQPDDQVRLGEWKALELPCPAGALWLPPGWPTASVRGRGH